MIKSYFTAATLVLLTACGNGNPFTTPEDEQTTTTSIVPEGISNNLTSISFNAADNTLSVTGLEQEGVPFNNTNYRLVTDGSITAPGYTVFTAQNDPLGRHATAFVASRDGVQAGVVMTGGQFNKFFGGSVFDRTGAYVAPTTPNSRFDVSYVGGYAAGLNATGPETDLLTVDPAVDADIDRPSQTAYIRGLVFINVDLNELSVEGEIYDRTAVLSDGAGGTGFVDLRDVVLVEGTLAADGTFTGNIELDETDTTDQEAGVSVIGGDIGDFAGVIGGNAGQFIAGGTQMTDFNTVFENEIEYGVFVLDLCTATSTDPICQNAVQP